VSDPSERRPGNSPAEARPPAGGASIAPEARGLQRAPTWLLLVGLALLAAAITIVAHYTIFPNLSWNRDEAVYTWQLNLLRDGHLTGIDLGFPHFFQPFLSAARDGKLFSQYPLGWPLLLFGSDLTFGTPVGALAVGGVLSVLGTFFLARELTGDRDLALVAATVMLGCPILAIQGGVFLSYLPTLGIALFFAIGVLSGIRLHRPLRLVGGGFLLGWVFMTRPFDAALWGIIVVGYVVLAHWREWGRLARAGAWVAVGLIPVMIATLAYNAQVTGSPTEFPITAKEPLDSFGFGRHRLMPEFGVRNYTPLRAVKSTLRTLSYLPVFLAGSYVGVVAAIMALWSRRRDRSTALLLALIVAFPMGYFLFWGTYVSTVNTTLSGPIYYVPLFAPLSILIAMTIVATWRHRRSYGIALVAVLVAATLPFAIDRVIVNHRISEAQAPWRDVNAAVDDRALVFVPGRYLGFLNPFATNNSQLDGRVLYAVDRGAKNLDLIDAMPDRTPYVQRPSLAPDELAPVTNPPHLSVAVEEITVVEGRRIALHVRVTNPENSPIVRTYVRAGESRAFKTRATNATKVTSGKGDNARATRTLATDADRGDVFETDWVLGIDDGGVAPADLLVSEHMDELVVGVAYADAGSDRKAQPALRETFGLRVHDGELELLEPPIRHRAFRIDGKLKWRERLHLGGLRVEPRPLAEPG